MVTIAKERRPLFVPNESSKAVISSSVDISGSVVVTGGITGSIKNTVTGNPFIVAGANITTNYNSSGQWVITGTGDGGNSGGGSFAAPVTIEVVDSDLTITTESYVNLTGLTQPRMITLPTPSSGAVFRVVNGDGTATSSSYVLVTGSAGATVNGKTYAHIAVVQPYGFTQYICYNNNWIVENTKTRTIQDSWLNYVASAGFPTTTEYGGSYTIGMQFTCITSSVMLGFRFKINVPAPRDFDIKLWTGGVAIASSSVAVTSSIDANVLFPSPVPMEAGKEYFLTHYGSNCYHVYSTTTGVQYSFMQGGGTPTQIMPINLLTNYCYGYGDSQPTGYINAPQALFAPLEPIIFG